MIPGGLNPLMMAGKNVSPNLMAWYRLDDNVLDSSGRGFNGTAIGSPTYAAGAYNNAIVLNGSSQTVDIGLPLGAGSGGTKTITFWVKTSSSTAGYIVTNYDATSNGFSIIYNSGKTIGIAWTGAINDLVTTDTIPSGVWTHIAAVFENATNGFKIYFNGISVGQKTPASELTVTNKIKIGSRWGTANSGNFAYFTGTVDDLQIYNAALTQTQIQNIMNTQYPD